MNLYQFLFVLLLSFVFALLEIQIEGQNGWAQNLPTWKIKNPIKNIIGWTTILDGYHFWMWILFILVFHTPFFFGLEFNLSNEMVVIEMFLFFSLIEDFLWFVFNPHWGLKKFFTKEIPWHPNKILFLPQNYWIMFVLIIIFELIKK